MKTGTKSILFGCHCFFLHPFFVAAGWWKLYGFPWDPRLWVAFFVHDLGYIGKVNMDDDEGEKHVYLGADIMDWLFGLAWYNLCFFHSRFWSKRCNMSPSRLCFADKLAFTITPKWLYKLQAYASGEIHEYMRIANDPDKVKYADQRSSSFDEWYFKATDYTRRWVMEHYKGGEDTWTRVTQTTERESSRQ